MQRGTSHHAARGPIRGVRFTEWALRLEQGRHEAAVTVQESVDLDPEPRPGQSRWRRSISPSGLWACCRPATHARRKTGFPPPEASARCSRKTARQGREVTGAGGPTARLAAACSAVARAAGPGGANRPCCRRTSPLWRALPVHTSGASREPWSRRLIRRRLD